MVAVYTLARRACAITPIPVACMNDTLSPPDHARRFGGLDRLYGPGALQRLAGAHVAVAGIGGVGSWCVEALARSGVGAITLIDLDNIAESNINRQLHALDATLGQAKVQAMSDRIAQINPACRVHALEDFVTPENTADVIPPDSSVLIDCTDQAPAKIAMILHARRLRLPLLVCGGAGGKTNPLALRAGDLCASTNDALLSKLRNVLRRQHGFARPASAASGRQGRAKTPRMGVRVLWFDQPAVLPAVWEQQGNSSPGEAPQGLSCAGYGSAVSVTATMGMAAAAEAIHHVLHGAWARFSPG